MKKEYIIVSLILVIFLIATFVNFYYFRYNNGFVNSVKEKFNESIEKNNRSNQILIQIEKQKAIDKSLEKYLIDINYYMSLHGFNDYEELVTYYVTDIYKDYEGNWLVFLKNKNEECPEKKYATIYKVSSDDIITIKQGDPCFFG